MINTVVLFFALSVGTSNSRPNETTHACVSYANVDSVMRRIEERTAGATLQGIAQQAAFCAGTLKPVPSARLLLASALAYLKAAQSRDEFIEPSWRLQQKRSAFGLLKYLTNDKAADAPTRRRAKQLLCMMDSLCGSNAI